jgi:hypothetical protein
MPWTAAAAIGGALIVSSASKKASQAQSQSAQAGMASQNDALNRQLDLQEPFRQTGLAGNRRLAELLGISQDIPADPSSLSGDARTKYDALQAQINNIEPLMQGIGNERMRNIGDLTTRRDAAVQQQQQLLKEFQASQPQQPQSSDYGMLTRKFSAGDLADDPVYNSGLQFGLDTGTKAINARATAHGGYDSGATLKALTQFGNDYGSTKANESYNRFNNDNTNIYNRLAGISGTGQTATNNVSNAIQNYGNTSASLMADAGNARAAGIVGEANAWGGALEGVAGAYNSYSTNKQNQSNFDRYMKTKGA